MDSKREPIPKGIRFEVFKRDKFTCQYCGQEAPDVILEVDHIIPVAEGGDNSLMNLITSCRDCNRGKGKKILSDDAALKKQKNELNDLQDRKEMVEMLAQWKKELLDVEEQEIEAIDDWLYENTIWVLTDAGKQDIRRLVRRFGFKSVYDAVEIAFDKYYTGNSYTWSIAFKKIGGICYNRSIGRGADYYAE